MRKSSWKEEQKTEENEKLSIKEIQNNSKKQEEKKRRFRKKSLSWNISSPINSFVK